MLCADALCRTPVEVFTAIGAVTAVDSSRPWALSSVSNFVDMSIAVFFRHDDTMYACKPTMFENYVMYDYNPTLFEKGWYLWAMQGVTPRVNGVLTTDKRESA